MFNRKPKFSFDELFNSVHSLLYIDRYIRLSILRSETPVYIIYMVANRYLKTIIQNDLAMRKISHLLSFCF